MHIRNVPQVYIYSNCVSSHLHVTPLPTAMADTPSRSTLTRPPLTIDCNESLKLRRSTDTFGNNLPSAYTPTSTTATVYSPSESDSFPRHWHTDCPRISPSWLRTTVNHMFSFLCIIAVGQATLKETWDVLTRATREHDLDGYHQHNNAILSRLTNVSIVVRLPLASSTYYG